MSVQDQHYDIFVSYARVDRPRVRPMIDALEAQGWRVFWDHDIPPGWTWDEYIGERLEQAAVVIVVWSKESIGSEFVRTEASRARRRRALIPVRIDDIDPPVEFERVHAADLIEWVAAPLPSLPEALHQELKRRLTGATAGARPMPGPTPSGEAKAAAAPPERPAAGGARRTGWRAIGIVAVAGGLFGMPVPFLPSLLSGALLAGIAFITRTFGAPTALAAIAAAVATMVLGLSATGATSAAALFYGLTFTAGHVASVAIVKNVAGDGRWRAMTIAVAVGALVGAVVGAVVLGALFGRQPSLTGLAVNFAVELVAGAVGMVALLAVFRQDARPRATG